MLPKYLEEWKVLRWAVAFLQKYCYKWHPRKCLGLDVANLIIFNLKNGENGEKSQNLFFSFSYSEDNSPSFKNAPPKTDTDAFSWAIKSGQYKLSI